jgi:hypothetical protein
MSDDPRYEARQREGTFGCWDVWHHPGNGEEPWLVEWCSGVTKVAAERIADLENKRLYGAKKHP